LRHFQGYTGGANRIPRFEYFPVYPPEFNPVESCWNKMKNEYLPNFVPRTDGELVDAVDAAAMKNNEEKKVMSCFNAAGIPS